MIGEEDQDLTTEDWKLFRQERQRRREISRSHRALELNSLTKKGYQVKKITDYQYRINNELDLYPTNGMFHNIKTGERGTWSSAISIVKRKLSKI